MDAQKLSEAIETIREALVEHAGPHRFAMVTITSMTENVMFQRGPITVGRGEPSIRLSAHDFVALLHAVSHYRDKPSELQDTIRIRRFTY